MMRRFRARAALRSCLAFAVVVLSLLHAPREALAEPAPGAGVEGQDAAACQLPDLRDADPETLLELALRCYDLERYATALAVLEHLHERAPNPTVVFNLGAVHAALGDCKQAKHYYHRYLEQTQSESGRGEALQQLEILGPCTEASSGTAPPSERVSSPAPRLVVPSIALAPTPVSAAPPAKSTSPGASIVLSSTNDEPSVSRVTAWVMFGGSAAFLLASGGFAYAGERQENRPARSQDGDTLAAAESEGLRHNTLAWACAGGALALASSGLLLLAFEPGQGTQVALTTAGDRAMSLRVEHQF